MLAIFEFNRTAQRVTCAVLAACIVFGGVSLGAYGVNWAAHAGHAVTITQIE